MGIEMKTPHAEHTAMPARYSLLPCQKSHIRQASVHSERLTLGGSNTAALARSLKGPKLEEVTTSRVQRDEGA